VWIVSENKKNDLNKIAHSKLVNIVDTDRS